MILILVHYGVETYYKGFVESRFIFNSCHRDQEALKLASFFLNDADSVTLFALEESLRITVSASNEEVQFKAVNHKELIFLNNDAVVLRQGQRTNKFLPSRTGGIVESDKRIRQLWSKLNPMESDYDQEFAKDNADLSESVRAVYFETGKDGKVVNFIRESTSYPQLLVQVTEA